MKTATIMRGEQLSQIARQHIQDTVEIRYVDVSELCAQSDSIIILTRSFLRDAILDELMLLKSQNNIICVDNVDHPACADFHEAVDVYIASSIEQFLHYLKEYPDRLVHLITHNTDPAIAGITGPTDYCNIGYFGEMTNALYADELQGIIDFVQTNNMRTPGKGWIPRLRHCNVHYAVRRPRPGFIPFTKGFTAAQCHANIIVPVFESDAQYYLSSDYPFILRDDSLKSVLEMIQYVKESFGGPEWRRGLEIMTCVRQRSSPAHIAGEIKGLLDACSGGP